MKMTTFSVIGLSLLLLAGCQKNIGDRGGRVDPYRTTDADRGSSRASIPAMLEFGDRTAEALAQRITDIDAVRASDERLILEMGSIENHTSTPTSDFELLRNRLRGQIFKSSLIKQRFMIVEGRSRMEAEQQRVTGERSTEVAGYDPVITYVLQGDFYESNRRDRRQYYMEFKLTNLASREIVFQETFDLAQR